MAATDGRAALVSSGPISSVRVLSREVEHLSNS